MKWKMIEREVMNPLGETSSDKMNLTPLPDDFEVVSLLDNTKPGSDVVLNTIQKSLGNRVFIKLKKPAGAPATIQQLKKAADADICILAMGDCGSCTSWVILDAIRLEKMDVPTISICSDQFISFAREMAKSYGTEDLRILNLHHPIAGIQKEDVVEKTLKIIPALQYLLQIP
jgi:precorrin-6B methylase 1